MRAFMTGVMAVALLSGLAACNKKADDGAEANAEAAKADIKAAGDAAASDVDAAIAEAAGNAANDAVRTAAGNAQAAAASNGGAPAQ